MKAFIDYITSTGAELINTKWGVVINSEHLDLVDLAKVYELCPKGFFVNPNVVASAETRLKFAEAKKDAPKNTIGIFVGSSNDPLAHLSKLAEDSAK